jgi:hypothetical protein
VIALGKIKGDSNIVRDVFGIVNDERNEVLLVNVHLEDLAGLADANQT